ncbi:MAG: hypothetical protein ACI9KE_004936 [Polyangiales bacterium]|jgi:hypothetical protein
MTRTKTLFSSLLVAFSLALGCGDDSGRTLDAAVLDGGLPDAPGADVADSGVDSGPACVDEDNDGYGEGCALGIDCNDDDNGVSPGSADICNGIDDDCDETVDEEFVAPGCALTEGVCAGAVASCGAAGVLECEMGDYGADFEAAETLCDALDNDCDGTTDEGCTCEEGATQSCGLDAGACMPGVQTCADGGWGACDGELGPMGESCNGIDDNCDGTTDNPGDLTAPDCPLQLGVCSGAKRACGGAAGWIACSGIASYGGDYQVVESLCDGIDNNCDGVTDEGCECLDGESQACGTDVGLCMAGVQTCTAGAFGSCAGEIGTVDEVCDGEDQDCDGRSDEDVIGSPCALQEGVCAGSTESCGGAGGFAACVGAADYGPLYEAFESACDGLDNNCDGDIDEGCACIDGETQACGSSVGLCVRGTQTCVGGAFGMCEGATEPVVESCNGVDDDCDSGTDDDLVAPGCALSEGVCAGSVQVCGGASGWEACVGTAGYGPNYLSAEDGATSEGACDGLDNDCNGVVDDGCTTGPVVSSVNDLILPDLNHRHLVYLENFDGNWDVVFQPFEGMGRRLTTTAVSEFNPKVYGNYVVFVRGEDTAARAVLYNLVTDTETVLSPLPADNVTDIYGGFALFSVFDGAQWDIVVYDIAAATLTDLLSAGAETSNEFGPSMRGNVITWVSDAGGVFLVYVLDLAAGTVVAQTPASSSASGQSLPVMDYSVLAWTDGRDVTSAMPDVTSDFNVFGSTLGGTGTDLFPGELELVDGLAAQVGTDIDGAVIAYMDYSTANADVGIAGYGTPGIRLTNLASTQADPTISGDLVLWEDNRTGTYDLYGSSFGTNLADTAGFLVIDEVLADPAGDANGDGSVSTTQDEFVEVINFTATALDISGVTISDLTRVRHTFADGTILPALGSIVVFGGGTPTGLFAGARAVVASTGTLGLNNTGDTITLATSGGTELNAVTYGGEGNMNQSLQRSPGLDGPLTLHSAIAESVGDYSPGTRANSFPY